MLNQSVSRRQATTHEDVQFRVMRLLQSDPDMSQREIAKNVGISLGALNYLLNALMDKGFIKLGNFRNSKHKFKYAYILTPSGISQKTILAGRFLKRKIQEYEALKAEINELEFELSGYQGDSHKGTESIK
jgi:EPS-associated MarR family transcriptional regulator